MRATSGLTDLEADFILLASARTASAAASRIGETAGPLEDGVVGRTDFVEEAHEASFCGEGLNGCRNGCVFPRSSRFV